jgi:serine/threonine protein phosphatase PrpC
VTERELREIAAEGGTPFAIVHGLVELAVKRGGPDNASAVAIIVDAP